MCGAAAWALSASMLSHFSMATKVSGPVLVWKPPMPSASIAGPYSMQPASSCTAGMLALNACRILSRWPGSAETMVGAWISKRDDFRGGASRPAATVHDGGGRWMTPGLIDCHTHLVFGGERAREFELRLKGASYEEIARAGGGIVSTVAATRAASEDALLAAARPRLDSFLREGVTTIEIKSGYGLDTARERKMLRVAAFRDAGVPIAIASNCNPGSAPVLSLLLMLSMAATLFRLTPEEALAGVTRNAARALGLDDRGVVAAGKRADFALWDITHPAELAYWIGHNPCHSVVQGGVPRGMTA